MTKYRVHLYCIARVPIDVEESDQLAAIRAAEAQFHRDPAGHLRAKDVEYAESISGALVDEAGDTEFEKSRVYAPPEWEG